MTGEGVESDEKGRLRAALLARRRAIPEGLRAGQSARIAAVITSQARSRSAPAWAVLRNAASYGLGAR